MASKSNRLVRGARVTYARVAAKMEAPNANSLGKMLRCRDARAHRRPLRRAPARAPRACVLVRRASAPRARAGICPNERLETSVTEGGVSTRVA